MIKKTGLLACVLLGLAMSGIAQQKQKAINWLTLNQLAIAYAQNPKPILFDVYTHWCGWCKRMDKITYKNEQVIKYVNEKYYAVKFNAEQTDSVVFNNRTFKFNKKLRTHELAMYLTFGRLEYPHTVFLAEMNGQPAPLSGFLKPADIEAPIKFFGEGKYGKQTFPEFSKTLKKEW